jgi:hypothetical protein
MRRILSVTGTGTGAVLVSEVALGHSLGLLVLGIGTLVLVGAALTIIALAAFSSRSTPMTRLRAFARDLRGGQRSALNHGPHGHESGHELSGPSLRGRSSVPRCGQSIDGYRPDTKVRRR